MREGKQTINTALLSGTENPGREEDTEVDGYHPASSVRSRAGYAQGVTYTKEGVSQCTQGEEGCPGKLGRSWIKKEEHWLRD